jgi:hypothetical protein
MTLSIGWKAGETRPFTDPALSAQIVCCFRNAILLLMNIKILAWLFFGPRTPTTDFRITKLEYLILNHSMTA